MEITICLMFVSTLFLILGILKHKAKMQYRQHMHEAEMNSRLSNEYRPEEEDYR